MKTNLGTQLQFYEFHGYDDLTGIPDTYFDEFTYNFIKSLYGNYPKKSYRCIIKQDNDIFLLLPEQRKHWIYTAWRKTGMIVQHLSDEEISTLYPNCPILPSLQDLYP